MSRAWMGDIALERTQVCLVRQDEFTHTLGMKAQMSMATPGSKVFLNVFRFMLICSRDNSGGRSIEGVSARYRAEG